MGREGKFTDIFRISELVELDNQHGSETAVLFLSPSTFAVLNWLSEIVLWRNFIVDDLSVDEFDRSGDRVKQGIYSEMGYTIDLSEYLERMATASEETALQVERVADNLEADDGSGLTGVAGIIAKLLPILLNSTAEMTLLQSNLGYLADTYASNDLSQVLQQALASLVSAQCCEPDATANGRALLPPVCETLLNYFSGYGLGDGTTAQFNSETGAIDLSLAPDSVNVINFDLAVNHPAWDMFWEGLEGDDGGNVLVGYKNGATGNVFVFPIPLPLEIDQDEQSLSIYIENPTVNTVSYSFAARVCESFDHSKPVVLVDLQNGIGELGRGWVESAGIWAMVPSVTDVPTITANVDFQIDKLQLDWTRPIDGTLSIEAYGAGGTLLQTYDVDMSDGRTGVIEAFTVGVENIVVKVASIAAQSLAQLVIWAFAD